MVIELRKCKFDRLSDIEEITSRSFTISQEHQYSFFLSFSSNQQYNTLICKFLPKSVNKTLPLVDMVKVKENLKFNSVVGEI